MLQCSLATSLTCHTVILIQMLRILLVDNAGRYWIFQGCSGLNYLYTILNLYSNLEHLITSWQLTVIVNTRFIFLCIYPSVHNAHTNFSFPYFFFSFFLQFLNIFFCERIRFFFSVNFVLLGLFGTQWNRFCKILG